MEKKKNHVSPYRYNVPEVEILEIYMEEGFAFSLGNERVEEEKGNGIFDC